MKKLSLIILLLVLPLLGGVGVGYAQIIVTIAGNHASGYTGDGGYATAAELWYPNGTAVDAAGNVYIADANNNVIRKVNTSGIISTFAGTGTIGFSGDGGQATASQLYYPLGMAFDAAGNMYITDDGNMRIRKVNTSGIISTVAGNGTTSYSGDGGPATAASFNHIEGIAIDVSNNIYVTDGNNNRIRKVDVSGTITTVAGNGTVGFSGDGGSATVAQLHFPTGIALDATGNLFIADSYNNCIRKINTSGIINTVAGDTTASFSGDGGPATAAGLWHPNAVALDATGNIYIADYQNGFIRKVNTSGIISTFAGSSFGYSGDGGPATLAQLEYPKGVSVDAIGNVYIADNWNHVIREVGSCIPSIPTICMIEVDTFSVNNIIYWNKTQYPSADTFYIYRDTSNYNYAPIGKVPKDSLSRFIDTVRSLYAANGDPNVTSWRYKIAYHDSCSNLMSPMSPWHQTIYQYNIGGLFIWNHYQIEGQTTPVPGLLNYLLMRNNTAVGPYVLAATASASSTNINDPQYSTYQTTGDWRVETVWSISCSPTLRLGNNSTQTAVVKSRSNVRNNRVTGVSQYSNLTTQYLIYPNPANDELTILFSKNCSNCQIQITNVLGETVKTTSVANTENKINVSALENGVYFVKMISKGNLSQQKIIVQH